MKHIPNIPSFTRILMIPLFEASMLRDSLFATATILFAPGLPARSFGWTSTRQKRIKSYRRCTAMTGKPANTHDVIQKMEAGVATLECALNSCYFTSGGDHREQTPSVKKRAELLFDGIRDMKTALSYARSGVVCPECMGISNAGSKFCGNCGLEFEM